MWTRGAALIVMALGSLILVVVSSWMLYNESGVGWVFFGVGIVGWAIFVGAVLADVRQARRGVTS